MTNELPGNTATFLLAKKPRYSLSTNGHQVKVAIVGSGNTGVAVGISILFKVRALKFNFFNLTKRTTGFRVKKFHLFLFFFFYFSHMTPLCNFNLITTSGSANSLLLYLHEWISIIPFLTRSGRDDERRISMEIQSEIMNLVSPHP